MKKIIFTFLLLFIVDFAYAQEMENVMTSHRAVAYSADLEDVVEKKFLRVLTADNPINYFLYDGEEKGYEYEMVKGFVDHLNKKYKSGGKKLKITFEMIPVRHDQLIPMLLAGYGDLIAAGLTGTEVRKEQVAFSLPYNFVDEVLVVNDKVKKINNKEDLAGLKVAVRKSSSYHESLEKLNKTLVKKGLDPVVIVELDEALETVTILELLSMGSYDITVADSHIADVCVNIFDGLRIIKGVTLRKGGKIAWAVNGNSVKLLGEVNKFLPTYKKGSFLGNVSIKKYFKNIERIKNQHFDKSGISPYDSLFKKYGKKYGFDWRLMAAMAYQESRFRPNIKNRWGAIGIFQIKQMTASEKYINIPAIEGEKNVENNIHAGIKYLSWIKKRYFDGQDGMKEKDKMRFAIASYNAGPARVRKARALAAKLGLDADKWFRNVEVAMLKMNRVEPVNYVSNINKRYSAYSVLGGGSQF